MLAGDDKVRFEWDDVKAEKNKRKHGISFDIAKMVFADPNRIEYYDDLHSEDEERWITIGKAGKILFVVYTERDFGNTIRLISARLATKNERRDYDGNRDG